MYRHDYSYLLTVNGTADEQKIVFDFLKEKEIIGEHLEPDGGEQAPFSHYCYPQDIGSGPEWYEDDMEETLHEIALKVPNAILEMEGEDVDDPSYGFVKRFHGDLYQEVKRETHTPPFVHGADVPFDQRDTAPRIAAQRMEKVNALVDDLCKNTDFDLLYAQKQALLHSIETGAPVPKAALEGLVNLLDQLGDLGEAFGRFQYDGIEPPFPMLPDYEKKQITIEPDPAPKIHLLCEEFEDGDAIRSFSVLAASHDKDGLEKMLAAKVAQDEYGYIADKGISQEDNDHFCTNFDCGFVEYYILDQDVLTPEKTREMLQSPAYTDNFHAPEGLRDILAASIHEYEAMCPHLTSIDAEKAADALMEDKQFQGKIKTAWWGDAKEIDPDIKDYAAQVCFQFVLHLGGEDPEFFERFMPPRDQTRSLDSIISSANAKQAAQTSQNSFKTADISEPER